MGSVTFTTSGLLLEYDDAGSARFSIPVPPGKVFISIAFQLNLQVGGGAAYSAGSLGVSANLTRDDVFTAIHHQAFPSSMNVFDALQRAVSGFVLPFQPEKIATLNDGDLMEFEFLGKLALGFGMTYGLNAGLLGGRSAGEITRSLGHGLASAALTANPSFHAGASFAFNYTDEDAFRFLFSRERSASANTATLGIFRKDVSTLQTKETLGIEITPGLSFDFTTNAGDILGRAVDHVFAGVSQSGKHTAASKLKDKLKTTAQGAVTRLAANINDSVNRLISKSNEKVEIELLQQDVSAKTSLFRVEFDFASGDPIPKAIDLAVKGDIFQALHQDSVTLLPGSFVENQFRHRSAFAFEFFDLWKWEDVVEYIDNIDVTYAGNGILRLIAAEGVKHSQGIVGHDDICDMHFLAQAAESAASGKFDVDLSLRFEFCDRTPGPAAATAKVLRELRSPELSEAADRISRAKSAKTAVAFPESVFTSFRADPCGAALPHRFDARNYAAFASAVKSIQGEFLGFGTYEDWCIFNRNAIDGPQSSKIPDRRNCGNLQIWPEEFVQVAPSRRDLMRYQSESARHFMNLVAALELLCTQLDSVQTESQFDALLTSLNGIVKHDVSPHFIKASLLALVKLAQISLSSVNVTVEGETLNVAVELGAGLSIAK